MIWASEVDTTKPINLYQLGLEIGGSPSFNMVGPDPDGVLTIRSDVDQAVLGAAVSAHMADPSIVPASDPIPIDPSPVTADQLQPLQDALAAITTGSDITHVRTALIELRTALAQVIAPS